MFRSGKMNEEEKIEGRRLSIFTYTGRRIVGIKAYKALIAAKLRESKTSQ